MRQNIKYKIRNTFIILFLLTQTTYCQQNTDHQQSKKSKEGEEHVHTNALIHESSPYLLEHAHNPVDWHPWGAEALEKARKENKPIIISVGYAACHWCHVMEGESFSDTAVANYMNEHFVAIKVDREERPDVDQVYMEAARLLTGGGGWPLNAFALPDGRPFYAGTYFPKDQWMQALEQLNKAYQEQHDKVVEQAEMLTQGIKAEELIETKPDATAAFSKATYQETYKNWQPYIDYKLGGYSKAPKFPLPVGWEFLLQYHYLTGDAQALEAVTITLDQMAMGGIYDHVGGGFARYSTDKYWKVPHFEKMLYDNGQLVSLYAHAYQLTGKPLYKEIIEETLAFTEREMKDPGGGFYASLNADSEGVEGKFYVWEQEEIDSLFDEPTARLLSDYYQVKKRGNWEEGNNILHRKHSKQAFSRQQDITVEELDSLLESAKKKLLQERSKRIRPSTDDKILTSWNALMLKGYIDGFHATGNKEYLETAKQNARFLDQEMLQHDGSLWRNYKDGKASINAFLDDYALLADAYIALYQATFEPKWLEKARELTEYALSNFYEEQSGLFYYTSGKSEALIARKREMTDNVIPASNSVMAHNLYRLGEYFYTPSYIDKAKIMLNQVAEDVPAGGPYYANWARLMGTMSYGPFEIAIMGKDAVNKSQQMQQQYLPTALFMGGHDEHLPLLQNKGVEESTLIYVCRNKTCKLPVKEVEAAMKQISTY